MDIEQIKRLAHLARINVSDTTVEETTENLNNILQLVDQLRAIDTDGVKPMAHPLDVKQVLRADAVTEHNQRDALQANAPAVENGLFLVPRVID